MKKVLYMTNIEVPYRVRFFNELAKHCDLTVLYEKHSSESRDITWAKSEHTHHCRKYLKKESLFFTGILKHVRTGYDTIIVGCYNSPVQMLAMLYMRLMRIPFIINLDGEPFLEGKGIKNRLKHFFLSGAEQYLVAGEKAAESLKKAVGRKTVIPYHFSSLSEEEIKQNMRRSEETCRKRTILVVGQYFEYKGMDVVLMAARMRPDLHYKFVGMGSRTELFAQEHEVPSNVELIPFLQKEELEREYLSCGMLVLPSRQECWGLVINEAASFGMPIVSTWGSGAAVEFLADDYPQFLAKPGDAISLLGCILTYIAFTEKEQYRAYLQAKGKRYSIESSVTEHINGLEVLLEG